MTAPSRLCGWARSTRAPTSPNAKPPSHWLARFSAISSAGLSPDAKAMISVARPSATVAPATSAGAADRGCPAIWLSVTLGPAPGEGPARSR